MNGLISQTGVIALAVIGATLTVIASVLKSSAKMSERSAARLGNVGYVVTGVSIAVFLYLGFVQ